MPFVLRAPLKVMKMITLKERPVAPTTPKLFFTEHNCNFKLITTMLWLIRLQKQTQLTMRKVL
jgi:hypothetical protein